MERAERVIADVGARIAELRRERGWTQQEAADRLRMEVQSLQRLERGENLTIRTLVKIANFLGVSTSNLFAAPTPYERRVGRPKKAPDSAIALAADAPLPGVVAPSMANPRRLAKRRKK